MTTNLDVMKADIRALRRAGCRCKVPPQPQIRGVSGSEQLYCGGCGIQPPEERSNGWPIRDAIAAMIAAAAIGFVLVSF